MLPSRFRILAEAINTKILTKNHSDSPHSHPDSRIPRIPALIPHLPTPIPCLPTLIPRVPTLIPRVPTMILHVPIIPLIPFPDSPFQLLQIALFLESAIRFLL